MLTLRADLTPREMEILQFICRNENVHNIARVLFIAPRTVNHHISNIYEKMNVTNRLGCYIEAQRIGLI